MLRRIANRLDFTKGLGFRLGALLSVAILPIGMISLFQNLSLSHQAERSNEMAILGRTSLAAAGERALLQSALGSADALGPAVLDAMNNPQACSDLMRSFIQRSATYSAAVFVRMDGMTDCASSHEVPQLQDMRDTESYRSFSESPGTLVTSITRGELSQRPVILVMQPLYREDEMLGFVGISLTQDLLRSTHAIYQTSEEARIFTFNHRGQILSGDGDGTEQPTGYLPRDVPLSSLLARTETTFRGQSNNGEQQVFAVAPVVPGLVYAIGSWNPRQVGLGAFQASHFGAFLLPVLLWLASLAVAYFAVYRLVLRHIRELRGQMRRFAIGNRDSPPPILKEAPSEIADVSQTFHNMAQILIRDEAALEAAVTEKTVLLKEVHHRVKNNLQLIASIINMQSRMFDDPETTRVLHSVQDRVAALATIYRNLYQAEHLDAVEADRLIGDIINKMTNATLGPGKSLRIDTQLQPLVLLPDQAVPLSLLTTEAFTNALKYAGTAPGDSQPWVRVSLQSPAPGQAVLEIVNSLGSSTERHDGTGLGGQLIEAFSSQLEGRAFAGVEGDTFVLRLPFQIDHAEPAPAADLRQVVLTSAARQGAHH